MPEVSLIHGSSHDQVPQLASTGLTFDIITVDGDHSEEGAMLDLENVFPYLNPKGAIVFDDITHPSHMFLLDVAYEYRRRHPEFKLILNTSQDNGCAIFLRGYELSELMPGVAS